jgi:hypothetical protein
MEEELTKGDQEPAIQHELTTIEHPSARNQDTEWRISQTGSKGMHYKTKKKKKKKIGDSNKPSAKSLHSIPPVKVNAKSQMQHSTTPTLGTRENLTGQASEDI